MKKKNRYILSLPERSIRFVTSFATSITSLLTKTILPKPIKKSTLYQMTFGLLQDYLIKHVAEISLEEIQEGSSQDYIYKKTAGSIVEGIGLLTIHYSPIWLLAMISDIAGGSQVYLKYLTKSLRKEDVIGINQEFTSVESLLNHIQKITENSAKFIDQPPIRKEEFMEVFEQLKTFYEKDPELIMAFFRKLKGIYQELQKISDESQVSFKKLTGATTLDLMKNFGEKTIYFSKISSKTTLKIFNDYFIDTYEEIFIEIKNIGPQKYLGNHMKPFIHQLTNHFKKEKITTTDKIIEYFENFSK
jgi:hypothetical protein